MRATRLLALLVALIQQVCLPSLIAGQANWTPNQADQHNIGQTIPSSALLGISVGMVKLSPEQAREQYNIEIGKNQKFVMVKRIDSTSRAAGGRSDLTVGDLVDTVVLGGDMPSHGGIKSLSDWNRSVLSCKPSCLLLVRHRGQTMSELSSVRL